MKEIRKVLVVKLDDLAQFVLSLAATKQIRIAHPHARITLLTTPPFAALAKASPYFDEVNTNGDVDPMPMARAIKAEKFDRIYDLEGSKRTWAIHRWLWPFRPQWSGPSGDDADEVHLLERHARQLAAVGAWPNAPTASGSAPPPDLGWILRRAAPPRPVPGAIKQRPYVVLIPGGPDGKRWPESAFGEAAAAFRGQGFDIVVVGGPEHSALARAIQRYDPKARDLTGRTDVFQIAILGSKAALAIGNDTGQTHLVAAAGAPTLALFSDASDAVTEGPRGHVAVLQSQSLADLPVSQVLRAAASIAPKPSA